MPLRPGSRLVSPGRLEPIREVWEESAWLSWREDKFHGMLWPYVLEFRDDPCDWNRCCLATPQPATVWASIFPYLEIKKSQGIGPYRFLWTQTFESGLAGDGAASTWDDAETVVLYDMRGRIHVVRP